MTGMIDGADLSHYQTVNLTQYRDSGRPFVIFKATEGLSARKNAKRLGRLASPVVPPTKASATVDGTLHVLRPRFVDPTLTTRRNQAHTLGLIVGLYHFARGGNPQAEAQYFLNIVGVIRPDEFIVLDQEVPNTIAWVQAWCDYIYAKTGIRPMVYMNQSANTGIKIGNWSNVACNYALWLAMYVYKRPTSFPDVPYWGSPSMWQYSDRALVPGVTGPCDANVFNGTVDQLRKFCLSVPHPAPQPQQGDGFDVGYSQWDQADKSALIKDLHDYFWCVPAQPPNGVDGKGTPDGVWPADRLRGVDGAAQAIYRAVYSGYGPDNGTINNFAWLYDALNPKIETLAADVDALAADVTTLKSGGIDQEKLSEEIVAKIVTRLQNG